MTDSQAIIAALTCSAGIMELFNYTSTFRRESNLPITTQYLRNVEQLESTTFMKTFEEKERFVIFSMA